MYSIRNMTVGDMEAVADMVALDHDKDPKRGYSEARGHTLDHLEIVPQHCYVVENSSKQVVAVMVLHPREDMFEIEDFHVKDIPQNLEALAMLKTKLFEYLETLEMEVLCCPYALKRLIPRR